MAAIRILMSRMTLVLLLLIIVIASNSYCQKPYKTSYGSTIIPEGFYPILGEQLTKLVNTETVNWKGKQNGSFFLGLTENPQPEALDYPIILLEFVPEEKGDVSLEEMAMLIAMNIDERDFEYATSINLDSIAVLNMDPNISRISFIEHILGPQKEWITKFNSIILVDQGYIFIYGLYPIKKSDKFYDDYRMVVHNFVPLI